MIGRSYGGEVALDFALRYPERVRALVLLEAAPVNLSPAADAFLRGVAERVFAAAEESGHGAAGEVLVREVSGEWEALPEPLREMITANGPAILAEFRGSFLHDGSFKADQELLAMIEAPTLVVSAADSRQAFRLADEVLAASLPNARRTLVEGGHLISPTDPAVIQFVKEALRPLD